MTDTPTLPGIYRLSIGPRTFYWGQAQGLRKRERDHLSFLRKGEHHNRHLQASFDKHGEDAFTFDVSLICEVEELNRYEQHYLDRDHGSHGCANIAKCAEVPGRGLTRSDECRAKMSEAKMGGQLPAETRAKISEALKGASKTAEHAAATREGVRAFHPNILVRYICGREEIWPSQHSLAKHLGHKGSGAVGPWLSGRSPIPAKYGITSVTRTNLPATIDPENHETRPH